jgi:hypothetical protein
MKKILTISLILFLAIGILSQGFVSADSNEALPGEIEGETLPGNNFNPVLKLSPEKNKAEIGKFVEYVLYIEDNHPTKNCEGLGVCVVEITNYKISIESNSDIETKLSSNEIAIKNGETEKVILEVKGNNNGAHDFKILVQANDLLSKINGALIVEDNSGTLSSESQVFFSGEGFIESSESSEGSLAELKILKDGNKLFGKAKMYSNDFRVEEIYDDKEVELDFYKPEGKEPILTFSGSIIEYKDFFVLEGKIKSKHSDLFEGNLLMFGENQHLIKEIVFENKFEIIENTNFNEILSLEKRSKNPESKITSEEDFYIKPTKISKRKLLGFISNPWGERVLEFDIIDGEGITKKRISEYEKGEFEGYTLGIGSLEDEDNIEFTISQTE